jgi:hypothetical protein
VKTFKSGFKTRYVVIDNGSSSSPNPIKIDCRDNDIDTIGQCNINDVVEVLYEIKGRKWEDKYFVNIQAESVRRIGDPVAPPVVIKDEDIYIPGRTLEEQAEWDEANKIKDVPF